MPYTAHSLCLAQPTVCALHSSQFVPYTAHSLCLTQPTVCALHRPQFVPYTAHRLSLTQPTVCALHSSQFVPYTAHSFRYTDWTFKDIQGNLHPLMWEAYQTLNLILVRHKPGWGSEIGLARDYTLPCDASFRRLPHCALLWPFLMYRHLL